MALSPHTSKPAPWLQLTLGYKLSIIISTLLIDQNRSLQLFFVTTLNKLSIPLSSPKSAEKAHFPRLGERCQENSTGELSVPGLSRKSSSSSLPRRPEPGWPQLGSCSLEPAGDFHSRLGDRPLGSYDELLADSGAETSVSPRQINCTMRGPCERSKRAGMSLMTWESRLGTLLRNSAACAGGPVLLVLWAV